VTQIITYDECMADAARECGWAVASPADARAVVPKAQRSHRRSHGHARRRHQPRRLVSARTHVLAPFWRYCACMPSVQIKDVPDDVHAILRRRAAAAGQSLQEYLRARLTDDARQPTLEEVLQRAGSRAGGSTPLTTAAQILRNDRDAA
jgi:plasmid stability protein